jgi:hypothetical protein
MMINTRSTTSVSASTQIDSASAGAVAGVPSKTAGLYPTTTANSFSGLQQVAVPPTVFGGNKTDLVNQLDRADFFARMAFLCLKEGDLQQANQYMQQATDTRKSIEPQLTQSQQQTLEQIMSLQKDAFQNLQSTSWFDSIFGQIKATLDLSQASTLSQNLRNSILSEGQLKSA